MFVERHGAGAEVYFGLHGWGGDRHTFAPLAPLVPAQAVFYSADLPGCGDSPAPGAWSVGAVVEEIVEAIHATKARRVTLVGACGGAIFALLAAQQMESSMTGRVVMIDPFAYLPRYFRLFLSENFGRRAYNATFAHPLGRWLTNQSLRGRRAGNGDLTASFENANHEAARRYLALYDEVGSVERFRGFAAPVEIAHGEKTFGAVRKSLALWREALPQARVRELRGAGHLPLVEATAQAADIIFASEASALSQGNESRQFQAGESGFKS